MVAVKAWLTKFRREQIVLPVRGDPRSVEDKPSNELLIYGYRSNRIFNEVLKGGQAEFDEPFEQLSPRDRVTLYAYFNQKAHVEELVCAFDQLFKGGLAQDARVVDIGCGPFTAGLALANVLGHGMTYHYYGVDRSSAMRTLGQDYSNAVRQLGEWPAHGNIEFAISVSDVGLVLKPSNAPLIFVLSYLLASRSVDCSRLVGEIQHLCERSGPGPVLVLYTNSTKEGPRQAYPDFERCMLDAGFERLIEEPSTIQVSQGDRDLHYALFRRVPLLRYPIQRFFK